MDSKESEFLKEKIPLKLEKINVKNKAAADKKRQEKLFEKKNMTLFKIFNVADLYEYHSTEQLYPDYNSRTSSFDERGIDVGDQGRKQQSCRQPPSAVDNLKFRCRQQPYTLSIDRL